MFNPNSCNTGKLVDLRGVNRHDGVFVPALVTISLSVGKTYRLW
jgi:hypothetical protein